MIRQHSSFAIPIESIFDEAFYTTRYPDVNPGVIDPFLHYLVYGKREARIPRRELDHQFPGIGFIDLAGSLRPSSKPPVMLVIHEATVTGAPMLGLELIRYLSRVFDIYLVSLGGGSLLPSYLQFCVTASVPSHIDLGPLASKLTHEITPFAREFEYVIANTVVAGHALSTFDRNRAKGVVTLIHEYPTPEWLPLHDATMRNSDLVVYSSEFIRDATIRELGSHGVRNSRVFQQGKIPYDTIKEVVPGMPSVVEDLIAQWAGKRLVVGCGTIDFRKGVDIFISAADLIIREQGFEDLHFIWLGSEGPDTAYHSMVKLQLSHSDAEAHFTFVNHLDNPSDLIERASVFLLTSRMDPLPNVAIDALHGGTPVICFRGAGGIPELITRLSEFSEVPIGHIVKYGDVNEMATRAIEVLKSPGSILMRNSSLRTIQDELATGRYVEHLKDTLAEAAERRNFTEALAGYLADINFPDAKEYVTSWSAGTLGKRKPVVGFNPGEIAEQAGFKWEPVESYPLHMQHAITHSDDIYARQTLTRIASPHCSLSYRVALHIHVYYEHLLRDIFDRLCANKTRPDIFLSVSSNKAAEVAAEIAADYGFTPLEIGIYPNRGRDVWPLLDLSTRIAEQYDLFGHVHTKDSTHIADRDVVRRWRNFLLDNTLGGEFPTLDLIADRMASDDSLAIAFPDNPYAIGWTANQTQGEELLNTMGWRGPAPSYFDFPVGTMFWAVPDLLALLRKLDLSFDEMPFEPLPIDGTLLHAIERILGIAPMLLSKTSLSVRMPGTSR
ncbi:rhamnan synthesis F family protein [Ferrimicrobium sp.]|uniref:rhamnan synthesis F family protein n=1 Tax=Ferrimicrobium sp. TaxID=2926050 RepID=UPI0026103F8C|nr:rhamnan synthesis F family protein [Ferrimicrobium sp.]